MVTCTPSEGLACIRSKQPEFWRWPELNLNVTCREYIVSMKFMDVMHDCNMGKHYMHETNS